MRRIALLLLILIAGDAVLLAKLKSNGFALRLVRRDDTGAIFEAAPDSAMQVRTAGFVFDYGVGMNAARAARLGLPAATHGDSGLEDLRRNIVWIQSRFRSGGFYAVRPWRIEEALDAARDPNRRFYCFSYAAAMVSLCEAQGYAARLISLDGHLSSSVYLPQLGRWVLADALHRVIPFGPGGRPLSAVEAHRLLRHGGTIEWQRVSGVPDDRPDTFDRNAFESMLRRGEFIVNDGPTTFGLLGRLGRAADLVRGRPRILQLAMDGQPPLDRASRRLRAVLEVWNLIGAVALLAVARAPR